MQASLHAETKSKLEVTKQKKKLESDVNELEIALDHSRRSVADANNLAKRLQQTLTDQQALIEEEEKQKSQLKEAVAASERQNQSLVAAIDELHVSLDQAERARKSMENDLNEAAERLSEFSAANAVLASQKRKADGDLSVLQGDLDDALGELKNCEERAKKAVADGSRLADEFVELFLFLLETQRVRVGSF